MNIWDHHFLIVARKYGDWPRVLDPAFSPTEGFYADLEAAGFTQEEFARLCESFGRPERENWLRTIAQELYWQRRRRVERMSYAHFLEFADFTEKGILEQFKDVMDKHAIGLDEADQLIFATPDLFGLKEDDVCTTMKDMAVSAMADEGEIVRVLSKDTDAFYSIQTVNKAFASDVRERPLHLYAFDRLKERGLLRYKGGDRFELTNEGVRFATVTGSDETY